MVLIEIWEGGKRIFLQIMQLCSAELAIFTCGLMAGYSRLKVSPEKDEIQYFFMFTESRGKEFRISS